MEIIKQCKDCWHWIAPSYAGNPGRCVIGVYEQPYENTQACDEIEDKTLDDEG